MKTTLAIASIRTFAIATVLLLGACAHPMTITPRAEHLPYSRGTVQKSVAYVISHADLERQVTSPGGGGDEVSYYPYRDLESGLFQTLSSIYSRVTLVRSETDQDALKKNRVSMIFFVNISTSSSSDSILFWPPTEFSVSIKYSVRDVAGGVLYEGSVHGQGHADSSEFVTSDMSVAPLAAKRACEDVLRQFAQQVRNTAPLM